MLTVLSIHGLRVVIYLNDHRPAHVHVISNGHEAVFSLNCPKGMPELRENFGFTRKGLAKIAEVLAANLPALCDEWRQIHEDY